MATSGLSMERKAKRFEAFDDFSVTKASKSAHQVATINR